jgi:hypothetical protein
MTSVVDVWRAVDPEARLVSGSPDGLSRPVRGVGRTRAAAPHLPDLPDGHLLVVDVAMLPGHLDALVAALAEAGLEPVAVWIAAAEAHRLEPAGTALPVIAGAGSASRTMAAVVDYLEHERDRLGTVSVELRLAGAESALADPRPGAPAGVVAARLRRGVAVTVDGSLAALNPRDAGTALATRFAATHGRLLNDRSTRPSAVRRTRDGLWILERPVTPTASAWMFDDLPLAAVDAVALDALALTLRALLRRPTAQASRAPAARVMPPSTGDPMRDTLLAVARANGRVAPAARSLGVHRNTVLYRLRRASAELGLDPRRADDALRLLDDVQRPD